MQARLQSERKRYKADIKSYLKSSEEVQLSQKVQVARSASHMASKISNYSLEAQVVKHGPVKPVSVGSSPTQGANLIKEYIYVWII